MPPEPQYVGTEVVPSSGVPELLVRTRREEFRLRDNGTGYRIGRDPGSDIVQTDSRVSWKHGVIRIESDSWIFEDLDSRNGTFCGGQRVSRVELDADCVLYLGHPEDGPVLRAMPQVQQVQPVQQVHPVQQVRPVQPAPRPQPPQPPQRPQAAQAARAAQAPQAAQADDEMLPSVDRRPTARLKLAAKAFRIGRSPDNDIPLAGDLEVSRRHAELRRSQTGSYEIVDLGSYNGTFVNGERVARKLLTEQDIVSIGHSTFRLSGGELRQYVDEGEVSFAAHDLVVQLAKSGKILLDHVTFPIPERCLLGIIGPSGAGKSTLLGALTGMRPADTGTVLYDNRDLYRDYAELRHRIGLVPQESVLHVQLTAGRALEYTAELRFPADTGRGERRARIAEVMTELGLTRHAETRADRLSGGQLKRVNVAQELLTKPSLLFLDEPTSGLDPGLDKSVMEQMRDLAHDGRTVVVVTHSVANLDTCDRLLVLVPGGKIAYYGPPADGLTHFGQPGWAEVFQAFERYPERDWAAEYAASPAHQQYVVAARPPAARSNGRGQLSVAAELPRARGALRQLGTLTRRYTRVIGSDRGYLAVAALLPLLIGGLIRFFPSKEGLAGIPHTNTAALELLVILVICACLAGAFGSGRELVKERTIYVRERAAGLSSGAYLGSKLIVLGVVSIVQSVVLTLLVLAGRTMPAHGAAITGHPLVEIVAGIAMVGLASTFLGLLVSALVGTSERATMVIIVITLFQVVLSGALLSLNGMVGLGQLAWLSPSRWGFAAVASTVDLNVINPAGAGAISDPLWQHTSSAWLRDMGVMAVLCVLYALLAWIRLRRLRPGRRR